MRQIFGTSFYKLIGFHQIELDHLQGEMPVIVTYDNGDEEERLSDRMDLMNVSMLTTVISIRPALDMQGVV